MPNTVLNTLHLVIHLIFTTNLAGRYYYTPILMMKKGTERSNYFPQVTQYNWENLEPILGNTHGC